MRISKRFKLGVSQFQLDFVDIDTSKDLRVFIDPHFLSQRTDRWSEAATNSIQSFFGHFLRLLKLKRLDEARELFSHLGEPNDTCLGMSKGRPRGSGVGDGLADDIFDSLVKSKAAKTGLLTDIEDARVFVVGVDKDRLSDMATALIRNHLIDYTISQCNLWGIPLTPDVPSGDVWDSRALQWTNTLVERLVIAGRPILLVPKGIVSFSKRYTAKNFHQHYLLTYLKHEHLRLDTSLVQKRKLRNGAVKRWVTKRSIVEDEPPATKDYLAEFTARHPDVFAEFKQNAAKAAHSLPDEVFTEASLADVVSHLLNALDSIAPGNDAASAYHRLVTGILELCFYPSLIAPRIETPLHDGRKRIDITFDNAAEDGFFRLLHEVHSVPSAYVMVECKNYSRDVNNPELDQLAGRFGVNRGQFGLLVSRTVADMDTLLLRCADAYGDQRGLIIPLCDDDLKVMLAERLKGTMHPYNAILSDRLRRIAMQ